MIDGGNDAPDKALARLFLTRLKGSLMPKRLHHRGRDIVYRHGLHQAVKESCMDAFANPPTRI